MSEAVRIRPGEAGDHAAARRDGAKALELVHYAAAFAALA